MQTVYVSWLGECPRCGFNSRHLVRTEGNEFEVFEEELVRCGYCSFPGKINSEGKVEWKSECNQ